MVRYYRIAYGIEIAAAVSIFLTLFLPWDSVHGTGLDLLQKAWTSRVAMGMPFEYRMIPVSQWWLLWILPLVSLTVAMRGVVGFFDPDLQHSRILLLALQVAQSVSLGWYMATLTDVLAVGCWLAVISSLGMALTILVELFLPPQTSDEAYLHSLPADHPDRILAGEYRVCGICGEFNIPGVRTCRSCGGMILPNAANRL